MIIPMDDFSDYGSTWKVMSFIGIDIQNKCSKSNILRRCVSKWFLIILILIPFYSLPMLIVYASANSSEFKTLIPGFVNNILAIALWLVLYNRRKAVYCLLNTMNAFTASYSMFTPRKSTIANAILVVVWVSLPIYCVIVTTIMNATGDDFSAAFTFGKRIEFNFQGNLIRFTCEYIYYFQLVTFPSFVAFVLCTLYHKSSALVASYGEKLDECIEYPNPCLMFQLLQAYSNLNRVLYKLNRLLSVPCFITVVIHCMLMFNCLATLLLTRTSMLPPLIQSAYMSLVSVTALTSIHILASDTSVRTRRVKETFERLHHNMIRVGKLDQRMMSILQIMKDKEPFVISACDMIYFTRSSILTAFGALFTYALLFIHINR